MFLKPSDDVVLPPEYLLPPQWNVCEVREKRGREMTRTLFPSVGKNVHPSVRAQVRGTPWVVDWKVLKRLIHTDERGEARQLWSALPICLDVRRGKEDTVAKKRSVQGSLVATQVGDVL